MIMGTMTFSRAKDSPVGGGAVNVTDLSGGDEIVIGCSNFFSGTSCMRSRYRTGWAPFVSQQIH